MNQQANSSFFEVYHLQRNLRTSFLLSEDILDEDCTLINSSVLAIHGTIDGAVDVKSSENGSTAGEVLSELR